MTIRNGLLQGMLNGKPVNCALRPGVNIPKGVYKLLPAVQDPVFGTLILMASVGQARDKGKGGGREKWLMLDSGQLGVGNTEQVFVLSAQAMPGRNNIVVNFGFSSLIEGLKPGAGEIEVV